MTTIREISPEQIIFHVVTNDLKSDKTASQTASSIIELQNSLKNETNSIYFSLTVPRNDSLNNEMNEVDSRLRNMCQQ